MMEEKTKFEDDTDISSSENEDEKDNFSQTDRNVLKDVGDPEVKSLHGKHKNGRLNIQPDFQRHFIWDEKKSSRLMESALLGILCLWFIYRKIMTGRFPLLTDSNG